MSVSCLIQGKVRNLSEHGRKVKESPWLLLSNKRNGRFNSSGTLRCVKLLIVTTVSKCPTASIFRIEQPKKAGLFDPVLRSFEMSVTINNLTRRSCSENVNLQQHRSDNLKPRNSESQYVRFCVWFVCPKCGRSRLSQSAARQQKRERLDHATYHIPFNAEVFRLFSHQFGKELPKR